MESQREQPSSLHPASRDTLCLYYLITGMVGSVLPLLLLLVSCACSPWVPAVLLHPKGGPARGQARGPTRGQARGPARGQARGPARGQARGPTRGQARGPAQGQARGPARGQARGPARGQARDQARGQALRQICGPYGKGEEGISLIREVCLR